MAIDDLHSELLAHLHANPRMTVPELAGTLGVAVDSVTAALDELLAAGRVERDGDRLVPGAASHPTPGVFVATERGDAEPVEVDYGGESRRDGGA